MRGARSGEGGQGTPRVSWRTSPLTLPSGERSGALRCIPVPLPHLSPPQMPAEMGQAERARLFQVDDQGIQSLPGERGASRR